MFPFKIILVFIVFSIFYASGQATERTLSIELNPGCSECSPADTLVYTKATGSSDANHQIWDFTGGVPTFIMAVGNTSSELNITWNHNHPQHISISEVSYSFAAAFDKIYEYDDKADLGYITPNDTHRVHSLKDMKWRLNETHFTKSEAKIMMNGTFRNRNGSIVVMVDRTPFTTNEKAIPHLVQTSNSSLIDISVIGLPTKFNRSRFALHFTLVSTDNSTDTMRANVKKSLDDEHTPGVFEVINIQAPSSPYNSLGGGYIQSRPVGFTDPRREVASSTNAHVSNLTRVYIDPTTLLHTYFKRHNPSRLLVQDMFISFGETGDGYYKQHNYTAWSFTFGVGAPPEEGLSSVVIIIIALGLSVPVALAVSGLVYVFIRKMAINRHNRFTDNDSFTSS